jgi:Ca2+/Na+ antiporter
MDLKNIRRGFSRANLVIAGIGALIGLLLIVIPVGLLLDLVFFIMGIATIVVSLPALISLLSLHDTKVGRVSIVCTALMVVAGFLMLFWHSSVLLIIVGVVMIAQPVISIVSAQDRSARLKAELPKLIIGIVLVLLGPANAIDILFDIAGVGLIVLSILYLIWTYRLVKKAQDVIGNRVFVDEDGNGTIDAVYVDTDGNGEADTATDYKEKK